MWLNNGKSADDVFNSLKLHYTASDFSHNPLGNTWVSYTNAIVTNDPIKTPALFANLETRLSDRPLLQILQMVKTNSTMKDAAIKLETKSIHKIFTSGNSPKDENCSGAPEKKSRAYCISATPKIQKSLAKIFQRFTKNLSTSIIYCI
ncbi:hypothetical protein L916_21853 [Phytophthora nicotianae]|uniref:RXLR phytopathogen effector protein WY-domain domain-containing protein n=1 Tax=Phytophthora nicotianae TaxID=4792 RepID=W2HSI2_PHYNI|nr:hypothetical protein L916_21853 [Phytophthora nicotianae]